MKLISCTIENFGKISHQSFHFDEKLTSIYQENGYGKTTLGAFIKAMFYGLEPSRKNSLFNDRRHFYPFNRGKFGGSLTFLKDGKEYRIERFFDATSNEEVKVYCDHCLTNEFLDGKNEMIGKMIFGVDKLSFEKTIFIKDKDMDCQTTADIKDKLTNSIDKVDAQQNFDEMIKKLETYKKTLKSDRKVVGEFTGEIPEKRKILLELEGKQRNYLTIQKELVNKYEQDSQLVKNIQEVNQQYKNEVEKKTILENWETYENYLKDGQTYLSKKALLNEKYPKGLPSMQEVAQMEDLLQKVKNYRYNYEEYQKSLKDENQRYESLKEKFKDSFPEKEKMDELYEKRNEILKYKIQIQQLESQPLTSKEERLKETFGSYKISPDDIEKLSTLTQKYIKLEEELSGSVNGQTTSSSSIKMYWMIAILFFVIILAGVGCLFLNVIIAILCFIIGLIGILVDGFIYLNNKQKKSLTYVSNDVQKNKENLKQQMEAILKPVGYLNENSVLFAAQQFIHDYQDYQSLLDKLENQQKEKEKLQNQIDQWTTQINEFLNGYDTSSNTIENKIENLTSDVKEYLNLKELDYKKTITLKEIEENQVKVEKELETYYLKYDLKMEDNLSTLRDDIRDFNAFHQEYENSIKKAEDFKNSKNLKEKPIEASIHLDVLQEQLSSLNKQDIALKSQIQEDERSVEQLSEISSSIDHIKEELEVLNQKYDVVDKTIQYLKKAEENLINRYIRPLNEAFVHYLTLIDKLFDEKVIMNKDFQVFIEKEGQLTEEVYFSAGERTIIALCFRLALTDQLYAHSSPFILMDDPFVSLDEKHMQQISKLLKELSTQRQIIYFCCHESRKVD